MANQVAARLSGDDYQHLLAWHHTLELLMPRKQVAVVCIEDERAGSADDVTIQHDAASDLTDHFYQIKYHVDHRGQYSTQALIDHKPNESSLLEKLFRTWKALKAASPGRKIEIHLFSNWTWDGEDKLRSCMSGRDNGFTEQFFKASARSDIGKLRDSWVLHLGIDFPEFFEFSETLRFKLGFDCWDEMTQRVAERMDNQRLKSDVNALLVSVGIVREWIKAGTQCLTSEVFEQVLRDRDLYQPPDQEPSVHVYLTTIKEQQFDIEPDYVIDWREHFLGSPNKRGHELNDPAEWNGVLLPHLEETEDRINREASCRLIRARGQARLSAWFAFGFTFSEVNRYTIEVDQQQELWRTDATPSRDFALFPTGGSEGDIIDGEGHSVAVGISVSGSLAEDVREDLVHRQEKVTALLLLQPNRKLGRECLRSAGDAVALAESAKGLTRDFVRRWKATRLLLYYYGPLAGACFIGHRLNAVCREVQVMENQQPGYEPSFLLQ